MPLRHIREQSADAVAAILKSKFDHDAEDIFFEVPPRRDLGDLAWPGALPLAKVLRMSPRKIADAIAAEAEWPKEVARVEVAGPGFLNLFLERNELLIRLVRDHGDEPPRAPGKVIVEHTNINPNKAAHIGHLRNAVLGDILVRCQRSLGHAVEVQNYIDDTGVQVADVVVGFLFLPEQELAGALQVETCRRDELLGLVCQRMPGLAVPEASSTDFDDLCWEVYPLVTSRYKEDAGFATHRAEVLHMIEAGHGGMDMDVALHILKGAVIGGEAFAEAAVARFAAEVAESNVRCHLATMARLGVAYDVLPHESNILQLGFWQRAFDMLKEAGAIRLEDQGKNAGCWVMSLADSPEFADMDDPDKILVRSNGTVTYTGKDIAYQLWKLGLLRDPDDSRHDFGYRPFAAWRQDGAAGPVHYADGQHTLVRTSSNTDDVVEGSSFGAGQAVFNVIDVRQSYPQKVVKEAVRALGHVEAADASIHFAYEMVALTPKAVRLIEERTDVDFGLDAEEMDKAYVEMSGRRGIGVKADEFLDILRDAAEDAVTERLHSGEAAADLEERARSISVGALRYLMARQSRNRVLAFDFDEALAFEGDTGPYLQYSAVRATKIFSKLEERRGEGRFVAAEADALEGAEIADDLWGLVLDCARRTEIVTQAVTILEFSLLAQHAHNLSQTFHKLYHNHPVVPEENEDLRRLRRAVFTLFADEMETLLEGLLGIPIPEEM